MPVAPPSQENTQKSPPDLPSCPRVEDLPLWRSAPVSPPPQGYLTETFTSCLRSLSCPWSRCRPSACHYLKHPVFRLCFPTRLSGARVLASLLRPALGQREGMSPHSWNEVPGVGRTAGPGGAGAGGEEEACDRERWGRGPSCWKRHVPGARGPGGFLLAFHAKAGGWETHLCG